jgi:uncharacterized transporter YbjL
MLLWFGVIIYFNSLILARLLHGRIVGWFMTRSALSFVVLTLSWIVSLFFMLFLAIIGDRWGEGFTEWAVWIPRSVGMTIIAIPLSFSLFMTSYSLSAPLSTFIDKIIRRRGKRQ